MARSSGGPAVPRLVSDGSRTYAAMGVMVVLGLIASVLLPLLRPALDDDDESRRTLLFALLLVYYVLLLGSYQLLTWWRFRRVDPDLLASWARATNPGDRRARIVGAILAIGGRSWSITAAALALGASLVVVVDDSARSEPLVLGLALLLVALAWTNVAVASAVSYLRVDAEDGGLGFPGGERPSWDDLFYLAVQVSTTFSSSDVEITTRRMRRLVTTQSLVAFLFNTVIVAVLVSSVLTVAG